ncbi:unnamed protein product [Clonostachys chloroleuca]|uniref:Phosphatidylglycerol lysyltransferase C-terminal domain-containing protein n=1 Tax=Clonostachys chloroleuca TaxID=1926264 RepID=A0AA35LYB1_9HYPO|nr:unnamed protein product [Clonostachys chloroleuca]
MARLSTSPSSTTTKVDYHIITTAYHAAHNIPQIVSPRNLTNASTSINDSDSKSLKTPFDQAYQLYARTSHMGILDPEYKTFTSQRGHGSLLYKIHARTLVVAGDPLCSEECQIPLLEELRHFRKCHGLRVAFVGASQNFAQHLQQEGWTTLHFGHERVINPLTNKVLRNQASKRMLSQNKQLLDPKRGGISVRLYCPSVEGVDLALEAQLQNLYDEWRSERHHKQGSTVQAFVTVYGLFSYRQPTLFLYTSDRNGQLKGFAMLRALGAQTGFHIDPCIASLTAPRGITDLLITTAMQLLKAANINYLSLGFEPLGSLEEIHGQMKLQSWLWKRGYDRMIKSVPVTGKAAYFSKFYPDEALASKLFMCLPSKGVPVRESVALMQFANMNVRQLLK